MREATLFSDRRSSIRLKSRRGRGGGAGEMREVVGVGGRMREVVGRGRGGLKVGH